MPLAVGNAPLQDTDARERRRNISYGSILTAVFDKVREFPVLLLVLILIFQGVGFGMVAISDAQFTAVATIGPAPSPLSDLDQLSGGLASALGSGLTKRLGVKAGVGGADLFDQYVELLTSNRVAAQLAENSNLMHAMFYRRYDWERHKWKLQQGPLYAIRDAIERMLHYPTESVPGPDDVVKFLKKNVAVDAPLTSSFVTVTLESNSPEKSEWMLGSLLLAADALIREDKRRDVMARITYLNAIVPMVTEVNQRQALSAILSDQEQSMMVVRADKRYAFALVDPPHSPPIPSSPSIIAISGLMLLSAFGCWGLAVAPFRRSRWLLELMASAFRRRSRLARGREVPQAVHRAGRLDTGASQID